MYSFTLGKRVLCEVVHSALPVLTVLSLGPVGQARVTSSASAVVVKMPVYTPLPSKKLYFLTPSVGKFRIARKQMCQNLSGMWEDVTQKVWQLEV